MALFWTLLQLSLSVTYFPHEALADESRRPHIILMMADQQRQDSIGAYPGSGAVTPNLDSLAEDGILFTNAWSSTPSCTPARAAILTGRSPWGHGALGIFKIAPKYPYELVHALSNNGYTTASIGKNHFGFDRKYPLPKPDTHGYGHMKLMEEKGKGIELKSLDGIPFVVYDDYHKWFRQFAPAEDPYATGGKNMGWNTWRAAPYLYSSYRHPTAWVAREAMRWIDDYVDSESTDPFFLKISFQRPHAPYDAPQKYMDFVTENYDLPVIQHIIRGNEWDQRFTDEKWCGPQDPEAWCGSMDEADTNYTRIAYHASVQFIDEMVGEIITKLKALGLYDNSYIIWTSDHGDQLGDHNLWRKAYPYNSNAKIPMIIKWDKGTETYANYIPRGIVDTDHPVELRDLLPTVHSAAGIDLPRKWGTKWDGLDMNQIVKEGVEVEWREWIDLEHSMCYNVTNHWNALTDGKMKFIFHAYLKTESLFDLMNDPDEMNDLALDPTGNKVVQTLSLWRNRMATMFMEQGRGGEWVRSNRHGTLRLRQREKSIKTSPNYPRNRRNQYGQSLLNTTYPPEEETRGESDNPTSRAVICEHCTCTHCINNSEPKTNYTFSW